MPDETEPSPPPASPYGPAEALAALTGDDSIAEHEPVAPPAAPPTTGNPAWVDRGRAILRVAIWVSAGLSVLLTVALVALGALGMGTADNDLIGVGAALVWTAVLGAPVLFVIALNLLVWRAMLRPLARRSRGEAIVLGIAVGLLLALLSVIVVVILLTLGFFAGALSGI